MRVQKTGNVLILLDSHGEIVHILPATIFVQLHPLKDNELLLSNTPSNQDIKEAIKIKVDQVEQIGKYYASNSSRTLVFFLFALLFDSTEDIFNTYVLLDGYTIEQIGVASTSLDAEGTVSDPIHYFATYAGATLEISDYPSEDAVFRISNPTSSSLVVSDTNTAETLVYNGSTAAQQHITGGKTVEVSFSADNGLFTFTEI